MGEHGRQVQKNVENKRRQIRRVLEKGAQGSGILDQVHGEADASVQKAEDVVDTGSALGKAPPVQRIADDLLNTGLVQKALARYQRGFEKDVVDAPLMGAGPEFNATVGGAREGLSGRESLGVELGRHHILRTGNPDAGKKGRITDTSFA